MIEVLAGPMSIVFVAGSQQILRLPDEAKALLDTMTEKGFQILVGDVDGTDEAVQRYPAVKSYPRSALSGLGFRHRTRYVSA